LKLQQEWKFKLGLPEDFELPKPVNEIKKDDIND